ncbi:metabotropic glutamate receptor 4-like [Patiria miniata]|uniref:G-protein coupled receptors family 3 profile domain-containing protein n=1 Tax=Patiria miniata TaxID=46514 RepID=A0A914B5N3_PATMI|nr:metabotropic glutamate receptor 4-like [Patiria miniata]
MTLVSSLVSWTVLFSLAISPSFGSLPERARTSYTKSGDFVIGGLFATYFSYYGVCDYGVLEESLEQSELMIFAIEQLNNRSDLLPNVTLGFDIRNYCGDESIAASLALSMAGVIDSENGTSGPHDRGQFIGIVGAGGSSSNIATALVTTVYEIPVVAYRGSTIELSDKRRFPYFLRTWPSASLQAGAIVDILLQFNWSYVGLIYSVNSYGIHGAQEVQRLAEKSGICLAYSLPIRASATENEIQEIVDKIFEIKDATVIVFITHLYSGDHYKILQNLWKTYPNHPGLRLVSSDTFGHVSTLEELGIANMTTGSFAIRNYFREVPGFVNYFQEAQADGHEQSPWLQASIEACKRKDECPLTTEGNKHHVVNAVYAFAWALDEILQADCDGKLACLTNGTVTGTALVTHLKDIKFNGVDGVFQFDEKGDPVGKYAVQSQQYQDGTYSDIDVGNWDSRGVAGDQLHIRAGSLPWVDGGVVAPRSVCREECRPGYKVIPLEEKCCYGCQRCQDNAVVVDDSRCVECGMFQWPSEDFTVCQNIIPSFIDWQNAVMIVVLVLSSMGVALTLLTGSGMLYYRRHALIKATGRELSFVNMGGILITFVAVYMMLAYPTTVSCFVSELLIALCMTLTFAPTTLKVNRIYRIFQAGKRSTKRPRFIGPRDQLVIASVLTFVQLLISICSVIWAPSLPKLYQQSKYKNYVEIFCEFGRGFLASCVYNLLLILVCCYYAFKTRKVPSNYNESKFIAVSVYSTLVLCLAAVPVYTTAVAVLQKVATLCMALLLNAYLTLVCVYLPKLYAARFVEDLEVADWRSRSEATTQSRASTSANASGIISRPRHVKVHPHPSTTNTGPL